MADVVPLPSQPDPTDSVVRTLESALAEARKGRFASVAIAFVDRDGATSAGWSDTRTMSSLIGSVSRLEHKLNVMNDFSG